MAQISATRRNSGTLINPSEPRLSAFDASGCRIAYFEWGERGQAPLLLIHATGFHARVWDQTHRFGGKAQVLAGALLQGLAFAPWPPAWQGPTVAVVVLVASGAAVLKSYLLWRALTPASRERPNG